MNQLLAHRPCQTAAAGSARRESGSRWEEGWLTWQMLCDELLAIINECSATCVGTEVIIVV
ncbi:MAG: hypothetical protein ACOYNZ_03675 [Rhodoferax sp.]